MKKKKNNNILIVDDEENIRLLYKEELEDEGYNVTVAANPSEAVEKMKESYPDLISLDVKMPGKDGIEFLRELKEKDPNIPVIICTAYSGYKQDFRAWASDAYIVKSADLNEFKSTIKKILGR
ncbi:MAG: response regulator [Nitrospinae bacterium]|nr:response regulator [Nitrospinota bacterium]